MKNFMSQDYVYNFKFVYIILNTTVLSMICRQVRAENSETSLGKKNWYFSIKTSHQRRIFSGILNDPFVKKIEKRNKFYETPPDS